MRLLLLLLLPLPPPLQLLPSCWLLLSMSSFQPKGRRSLAFGGHSAPHLRAPYPPRVVLLTSPAHLCSLQCREMCCGHSGGAKVAHRGHWMQRPRSLIISG